MTVSRPPGALLGPDADVALGEDEDSLVGAFNRAGVLVAADVHVARVLARLGGEKDASVVLAAALAVRAPRAGHVLAELSTLRETVTAEAISAGEQQAEVDLSSLPWPELTSWLQDLARSPLVANGPLGGTTAPCAWSAALSTWTATGVTSERWRPISKPAAGRSRGLWTRPCWRAGWPGCSPSPARLLSVGLRATLWAAASALSPVGRAPVRPRPSPAC